MTNIKNKGIFIKAVLFLLVAFTVIGGVSRAATAVSAETGELPNVFTEWESVIGDPVAVTNADGVYYEPTAYVYYGQAYNSATGTYEPILHRVLDADKDIAGNGGAMLLLTENTVSSLRFTLMDDEAADYVDYENSYASGRFKFNLSYGLYEGYYEKHGSEDFPDEVEYIRAVTKSDSEEAMDGLFGLSAADGGYYWQVIPSSIDSNAGNALVSEDKIFLLSVEEAARYIGNYRGAPGFAAKNGKTGVYEGWWLRTAVGNSNGAMVAAVDANGNLGYARATGEQGIRYAFNLETEEIAFAVRVADRTYRLAMNDPRYGSGEGQFSAVMTDCRDGSITVEYWNYYRAQASDNSGLGYIIYGEDGNAKYYGRVDGNKPQFSGLGLYGEDQKRTTTIDLPDCYEEGDTVKVFWESGDLGADERGTTFVSNFVDLGCIHTPAEGKDATCSTRAVCGICGEKYGKNAPTVHARLESGYSIDVDAHTHSRACADCGEIALTENCSFGGKSSPTYCTDRCVCGNLKESPELHDYDENGVCYRESGKAHYRMPEITVIDNWRINVKIKTSGEWNAYAQFYNGGGYTVQRKEMTDITISADLDFSGMEFIPLGTRDNYAYNIEIDGGFHTVSGIDINDPYRDCIGFIGDAVDVTVRNLFIKDSRFIGKDSVGAVVGRSDAGLISCVFVIDTTVSADRGACGGLIGRGSIDFSISSSFIYNVIDGNGNYLDFFGDGEVRVDTGDSGYGGSYRLADESDGNYALSAEDFASGIVAYRYNRYVGVWGQRLGVDPYPVYNSDDTVYMVSACDGSSTVYMNENIGQLQHGDYVGYEGEPEWTEGIGEFGIGAYIRAVCGDCGQTVRVECDLEYYFYSNGKLIAKMDATPYLTVNGERVQVGEKYTAVTTRIESLIGITPKTVEYDGGFVSPEEFMDNHRLVTSPSALKEYEVFFVDALTGERLQCIIGYDGYGQPIYGGDVATDVGTYHLLVEGRSIFEGQQYLYENVLTITKATVTVSPFDVYKTYDGNGVFEPEFTIDKPTFSDWDIKVSYSAAAGNAVGEYTLKVTLDTDEIGDNCNVIFKLSRDTVTAIILPNIYLTLNDSGYPTEFTYGDAIPDPLGYFTASAPAEISYEWYTADNYELKSKLDGSPKNAGDYILRVRAVSLDGSLVSAYTDVAVSIYKRSVSIELIIPEGVTTYDYYGSSYYVLKPGQLLSYRVNGLVNGETPESVGMVISFYVNDGYYWGSNIPGSPYEFPTVPNEYNYRITYSLERYAADGSELNYESDGNISILVDIEPFGYAYPVDTNVSEGNELGANIILSFDMAEEIADVLAENGVFNYTVTVMNSNGDTVTSVSGRGEAIGDLFAYISDSGAFFESGEYTVSVTLEQSGVTREFSLRVEYRDTNGELVDIPSEMGRYTVAVYTEGVNEPAYATLTVSRELVMNLKPQSLDLVGGELTFDPTKIVMEAGKVIKLGHTLVDVVFEIDTYNGIAYIDSVIVTDEYGNDVSYTYTVKREYFRHGDEYGTLHLFDNSCDYDCNIDSCEAIREASHTGGDLTCCEPAICTVCGSCYGDTENGRHISSDILILPNVSDLDNTHLEIYTCCGGVRAEVEHKPITPATCTTRATCSDCGRVFGEVDPDNHASNERRYSVGGEGGHITTYVCCGAEKTEAHEGGVAYCNVKAKCELCGGSYGELDSENHSKKSVFRPDSDDRAMHNEVYDCCGHAVSYPHRGGAATCTEYAVCTDCSAEYGGFAPDSHASGERRYEANPDNPSMHLIYHKCCGAYIDKGYHSGGTATCQSGKLCEACGLAYGDTDPDNHASEELKYYQYSEDESSHVKVSACCDSVIGTEAHSFGEATCASAETCVCGIAQGDRIPHTYDNNCDSVCNNCGVQTRAETFHVGKDGSPCENCGELIPKRPISGGAVSAIVTASTVTAGFGGFAAYWFIFKKKTLAELLKLVIGK